MPQTNRSTCFGLQLRSIKFFVVTIVGLYLSLLSFQTVAQNCGDNGQRACCLFEAEFGACMAGLLEIPGCVGDCQCTNSAFQSSSSCVLPTSCGGLGERACCFGESGFGPCEAGLVENAQPNAGYCTNLPGTQSSSVCLAPTPCGGVDQRACCAGEAGFGACQSGLIEQPQANTGQCNNLAPGIESQGICRAIPPCGQAGQRACCAGEAPFGACVDGLAEISQANAGQCGNFAWGTQSSSICQAVTSCGGLGERACCLGESQFGACEAGLVENAQPNAGYCANALDTQSNSICLAPTPCGGPDQRACCAGEAGFGACQAGLVEEPIANTGQCNNLAPGIESQGICRAVTPCGSDGQRACCAGEAAFGACMAGHAEIPQANAGQCGNQAWGIQSNSVCQAVTPCGGPGQRACCVGEQAFGACLTGINEVPGCAGDCLCTTGVIANSTCVIPAPCGGLGERACCVGEGSACDAGLNEIPGCTGDCFCGPTATAAAVFSSSSCGLMAETTGEIKQIPEPDVNCTNCDPKPQADVAFCSLKGVSDMHAHMFAHLAHGGAAFVGKPYDAQGGINQALKQDYGTDMNVVGAYEGGAPPAHVADGLPPDCPDYLLGTGVCDGQVLWHGDHQPFDDPTGTGSNDQPGAPLGAPLFNGWPTHQSAVHQQMYYKWLERAYRGGLRHMVMMAVHSEAMCEVSVQLAGVDCADSMAQIDLQIQAAYDFQDWLDQEHGGAGEGWFRIVHTPVEARRVILQGKLAVTLGIEVDNLFNCKVSGPCPNMPAHPEINTVQQAVDYYYNWGVRHIFPVHNFDNAFSGAALWLDPLAVGNRYIEYQWQTGQDCATTPGAGSGYGFRHDNVAIDLLRALACAVSNGPLISCDLGDIAPPYNTDTSCNAQGLTPAGVDLIQRLMAKGMLIDIDHMSSKALDETLGLAIAENSYPLVASHGQFFDLHPQLYGDPTTPGVAGQAGRHERMRTPEQLEQMRQLGGLVALLTLDGQQTLQHAPSPGSGFPTIEADCRQSTKTWVQGYQYAVEAMQGPVAIGTDFNGVAAHTGPRFGSAGCGGEDGVVDLTASRKEERSAQERAGNQLIYPYTNEYGTFDRQITGQQTYDFNTDGLAHMGLLPDMLADVQRLGMSEANMEPLFRSANRYLEVWETALGTTCDINDIEPSDVIFEDSFE
ncbi:MAG: membrane dipeptidase [Marinicella sp.]